MIALDHRDLPKNFQDILDGLKPFLKLAEPPWRFQLDNYPLACFLGAGGMGVVFLAVDSEHLHRALKTILPASYLQAHRGRTAEEAQQLFVENKRRFEFEIASMTRIMAAELATENVEDQRRIRKSLISFASDGVVNHGTESLPYFCTAYEPGRTLRERMKLWKTFPQADAIRITFEILASLRVLHDLGLIHRDLKPENILLSALQADCAKLMDFGLVFDLIGKTFEHHGQPPTIGTPRYVAPERLKPDWTDVSTVSELFPSDLFSLGCVLYEMLLGTHAYQQYDLNKETPPEPPRSVDAEIHPGLSGLVMRLVNNDSARRPHDCEELETELQDIVDGVCSHRTTIKSDWPWPSVEVVKPLRCIGVEAGNQPIEEISLGERAKIKQYGKSALIIGLSRRTDFATEALEILFLTVKRLMRLEKECESSVKRITDATDGNKPMGDAAQHSFNHLVGQFVLSAEDIAISFDQRIDRIIEQIVGLPDFRSVLTNADNLIGEFDARIHASLPSSDRLLETILHSDSPNLIGEIVKVQKALETTRATIKQLLGLEVDFLRLKWMAEDRRVTVIEESERG